MGFKEKLAKWKKKRKLTKAEEKKRRKELEKIYAEEHEKAMKKEARKAARRTARKKGYRKGSGFGGALGGLGTKFMNYADKVSRNIEESPLTGGKGSLFGTQPKRRRSTTPKKKPRAKYATIEGKRYKLTPTKRKKKKKKRRKHVKLWFE